jgi:hypothetical protein
LRPPLKLLVDESLPRRLKRHFPGHTVLTIPECGWAFKSNGALPALAAAELDIFLTAGQYLEYQQSLQQYDLAIIVLAARSNRLPDLLPLLPNALAAISHATPGSVVRVAI